MLYEIIPICIPITTWFLINLQPSRVVASMHVAQLRYFHARLYDGSIYFSWTFSPPGILRMHAIFRFRSLLAGRIHCIGLGTGPESKMGLVSFPSSSQTQKTRTCNIVSQSPDSY